jgi:protein-disulfide isomerase
MEKSKMTKRDYFALINQVVASADVADEVKESIKAFTAHEVELLDKRHAKSGQTKTQKENVAVMDTIKAVLSEQDSAVTISELMKDSRLVDYSNQKLSALLKKLVAANEVIRTEDKKKAFFSIAE